MPKTRNVTRAEWAVANAGHAAATHSSTTRRGRSENSAPIKSEEKENAGKMSTRSRMHRRGGLLGTTANALGAPEASVKASKQKKVSSKGGKPTTLSKEKKMPLQDITSQFLPAPEFANRGAPNEGENFESPPRIVASVRPAISPLPPSSPPSDFYASPTKEKEPLTTHTLDDIFSSPVRPTGPVIDPWREFDDAGPAANLPTPDRLGSDPFGFRAVERKLKEEREFAIALSEARVGGNVIDDDDADLVDIPFADTSSPRPVRRLKRTHVEDGDREGENHTPTEEEPPLHSHFSLTTPPTPHKDKQKRRRLSHEGHIAFSPCESSFASSPSPSKHSARKHNVFVAHDPLDDFNHELEKSCGPDAILDALIPSSPKQQPVDELEEHNVAMKPSKPQVSKSRKPPSTKAKTVEKPQDLEDKLEQRRVERLEYFKRLEKYEVEKEDIYIV